jgi:hypothetical protein
MRASIIRSLRVLLVVLVLLGLRVPLYADATTINYTPAPTTYIGYNPCGNFPGYGCATSAYFDTGSLIAQNGDEISSLFMNAWDAWNSADTWTLEPTVDDTLGGTFNVTTAAAGQFFGVVSGGLTIQVTLSGVTLPTLTGDEQLLWVQGLELNYTPGVAGPAVTPYYTMDTSTLSGLTCSATAVKWNGVGNPDIFCPPAYPYQYTNNSFYDQPKGSYQPPGTTQKFFDANAYLAVVDYTDDTVQLYDGISYGFQNYISPEPGTLMLFGTGLLGIAGLIRRRAALSA